MKTILSITTAVFAVINLHAQGTVLFDIPPITNGLTMMLVTSGTLFRLALYFLPDQPTTPTSGDFDQRGVFLPPFAATLIPGGMSNAGTRSTPDGNPSGSYGWFQVRAWETAFGTSYEQVRNNPSLQSGRLALIGTSNIIRVGPLGGGSIATPTLTGAGLKGFVLVPVPEPSTISFAFLGLAALALLRFKTS